MIWHVRSAFAPLTLSIGSDGHLTVQTLGDAAALLIRKWPRKGGNKYREAVKACFDAMRGRIAPEQAREAVLRAANEAGIETSSPL